MTTDNRPGIHPLRLIFGGVVLLVFLAAVIVALALISRRADQQAAFDTVTSTGGELSAPIAIPDFTLTSHTGEPLALDDLRGQPSLLVFGYTHCPDVCPLTLTEFRRVKQALPVDDADGVNFVFVSVDGQRDTPDVLNRYLSRFDAEFIGLTTDDADTMQQVADSFNVYFATREVEGTQLSYMVDHTASSFMLNADGELVRVFPFATDPALIAEALAGLL